MKEIDYTDQGGSCIEFYDRRMQSFYTPYGIQQIESNFIARIKNIHNQIKNIYNIDRVKATYMEYKTVYNEISLKDYVKKKSSREIRVIWIDMDGRKETHDFVNGDERPIVDLKTKKEDPDSLIKQIKNNPHFHKDIKNNLLGNLKRILLEE